MNKDVLKCIVIDDSTVSRHAIATMINNHSDLVLVTTYRNAIEALNNKAHENIDLIFLDVEMPRMNGFQFLEALEQRPQVILVCDKADYALKAFDYAITDYLKKPLDKRRFDNAIRRALAKHRMSNRITEKDCIDVKCNLQKKKVIIDHINFIETIGDYIRLVTDDGNLLVLTTLKSFLKKLPKDKFIRIHRSYCVNVTKIDQFCTTMLEIGGREIPISRGKSEELEKMLNYAC
ncbi:LytR/AlgR family response regulator transcription factor [Kriegella aquimaris]|uniref:Two component transcriptional regulator, LytTR family n=1 Tax=Kriegella aquimaris TaxID=192904 RepID=A0A1G9RZS5_9FLAO|nr:LytTR family DNA-binding domain-containing protein [Kriegella aquimaris]SDM28664.1 two component transcriptional regulator, LytTR family [Kriegella aquimaris]